MAIRVRDAVEGHVWLYAPSINRGGGPERVATEEPPADWKPRPFLGFAAPTPEPVEAEPLLWDGDDG